MSEPPCPSYPAIDPVGTALYLLLAIVLMIIIVSILWKGRQPSCHEVLLQPLLMLLVALLLLLPLNQLINWYVLRVVGIQTTAVVVDRHVTGDAKALFRHQLDFMYRIRGSDGAMCTLIQRREPVPAEVYAQYPISSTVSIRYLPYNPAVAHTDNAEQVAWADFLVILIAYVVFGVVGYLRYYRRE